MHNRVYPDLKEVLSWFVLGCRFFWPFSKTFWALFKQLSQFHKEKRNTVAFVTFFYSQRRHTRRCTEVGWGAGKPSSPTNPPRRGCCFPQRHPKWGVLGTTGVLLQSSPRRGHYFLKRTIQMCTVTESPARVKRWSVSAEVTPSGSRITKWLSPRVRTRLCNWLDFTAFFCQNSTCQHKVKTKYDEVFWKHPLHWWAESLPAFAAEPAHH